MNKVEAIERTKRSIEEYTRQLITALNYDARGKSKPNVILCGLVGELTFHQIVLDALEGDDLNTKQCVDRPEINLDAANQYIKNKSDWITSHGTSHLPVVICNDGYTVSMQVGAGMYCEPRVDGAKYYSEVELGCPNRADCLINKYSENPKNLTGTVYLNVPVSVVDALFEKHGGISNM